MALQFALGAGVKVGGTIIDLARDAIAKKLDNKDITDQKLKDLIVRSSTAILGKLQKAQKDKLQGAINSMKIAIRYHKENNNLAEGEFKVALGKAEDAFVALEKLKHKLHAVDIIIYCAILLHGEDAKIKCTYYLEELLTLTQVTEMFKTLHKISTPDKLLSRFNQNKRHKIIRDLLCIGWKLYYFFSMDDRLISLPTNITKPGLLIHPLFVVPNKKTKILPSRLTKERLKNDSILKVLDLHQITSPQNKGTVHQADHISKPFDIEGMSGLAFHFYIDAMGFVERIEITDMSVKNPVSDTITEPPRKKRKTRRGSSEEISEKEILISFDFKSKSPKDRPHIGINQTLPGSCKGALLCLGGGTKLYMFDVGMKEFLWSLEVVKGREITGITWEYDNFITVKLKGEEECCYDVPLFP